MSLSDQDDELAISETPIPPYKHDDDGLTHVNVFSQGKTQLGRCLSNFAKIGFAHPRLGKFQSVEGFWYYIKTGCKHEELRTLHGHFAKSAGQKLEVVPMPTKEFHRLICEAITCKIEQNTKLLDLLLASSLPLTHYYVFETNGAVKQVFQPKHKWQLVHIESIRRKWLHIDRND